MDTTNRRVVESPVAYDIPGTNVASGIAPFKTTDNYATHYEEYGQGGYRSVKTIEERNAIPKKRRKLGMLVNVLSAGIFKLTSDPGNGNTTDENWGSLDSVTVQDATPSDNPTATNPAVDGNLITLSDGAIMRTQVTPNLPSYVFNVFLKAKADYAKIRWCVVVGQTVPTVTYVTTNSRGETVPATVLVDELDTLELRAGTTKVLEFETLDHGDTWFVNGKTYNKAGAETDPNLEIITRAKLNKALEWETVEE